MFGGTSSQMLPNIFFRHDEGMNWFDEVSGVKGPDNQNYHSEIKRLDTQNDAMFDLRYCTFSKAHHFWYLY